MRPMWHGHPFLKTTLTFGPERRHRVSYAHCRINLPLVRRFWQSTHTFGALNQSQLEISTSSIKGPGSRLGGCLLAPSCRRLSLCQHQRQ